MRSDEHLISITTYLRTFLLSCFVLLLSVSCHRNSSVVRISSIDDLKTSSISTRSAGTVIKSRGYNPPKHYIPYDSIADLFPTKFIRLNFHYMNDVKGDKNYTGQEALDFTYYLVDNANKRLLENHKMKLPEGNMNPALDPRYQYIIQGQSGNPEDKGIYFHADDELYYFLNKGIKRNNYKRAVIDKYAVNLDSVLNVFVMPHHPDSLKSKNYNVSTTGIALGSAVKIAGLYEKGEPFWEYATLLNHEIGHVMGLTHTWNTNDGCDDTPKNENCFTQTKEAPCDGIISNNLMDYNSSQMAISPCQLGTIHKNINELGSRERSLVRHDWCDYHQDKTIVVSTKQVWNGAKDLFGDLVIKSGAALQISGRVSFPISGRIIMEEGAKLILNDAMLHNSCGDKWGGIECYTNQDVILIGKCDILNVAD